ncbi:MAG TPA: hypothetical protein EYM69_02225, partial [Dehalococcoidia bacterium]|nr:hypothetical protein [Dehalococcoidia bacterium]
MKLVTKGQLMAVAVLLIVITGNMILTGTASAQSGTTISGIVVGVDTDPDGRLTKFAIADSSGTVTTFGVSEATEYGLENQAGDRWVSTQGEQPVEIARRL